MWVFLVYWNFIGFFPQVLFRTKALVDYMKHAAFFMLDQRLGDDTEEPKHVRGRFVKVS